MTQAPDRIRIDPDYNGFDHQIVGWADGFTEAADTADWPLYIREDLVGWPPDGRPMSSDQFIILALTCDDPFDGIEALKSWVEGAWEGAIAIVSPTTEEG